jgi:hypothetical protein
MDVLRVGLAELIYRSRFDQKCRRGTLHDMVLATLLDDADVIGFDR